MACTRPIPAYRAPGGGVVFNSKEGYSDRPLSIACGQCQGCRLERSRQWAVRCMHEAKMHSANSFITLTYSPAELPEDMSLDVTHFQKFMKRLRKRIGKVRFYHCGEYGEENLRPHYHAILFGEDFSKDRVKWKDTSAGPLFTSKLLADTWGKGFVTIGEVTWQSCAYVARYIMKKANGDLAEERYQRVDARTGECWQVKPEYTTMSRRPGIGKDFYDKYKDEFLKDDFVVHDNKKYRVPRFYDGLHEKEDPQEFEKVKRKRVLAVLGRSEDLTPERLRVREEIQESRIGELHRSL